MLGKVLVKTYQVFGLGCLLSSGCFLNIPIGNIITMIEKVTSLFYAKTVYSLADVTVVGGEVC